MIVLAILGVSLLFTYIVCTIFLIDVYVEAEDEAKQREYREMLESQNEEFEYGHNVDHTSNDS